MKIWGNIGGFTKLLGTVLRVNKYAKAIEQAKTKGDLEAERTAIEAACTSWVNDVIKTFDMHFEITGKENIPPGPCVFIGNHQAYCDIMAVLKATEGHQIGFIAKEEFKPVPYLSSWILRIRGLFIPTLRNDTRESLKVINEGVQIIKDGFSMMIFPEGRRSWGPEMGEFKPGSFKLATKAKVPVVPVTINGTYKMFEEREIMTPGQTATVVIHPPIETAGLSKAEEKELPEKVWNIINSALPTEPREEDVLGKAPGEEPLLETDLTEETPLETEPQQD